jgi:endonuclease YncB( thermonuclease family)
VKLWYILNNGETVHIKTIKIILILFLGMVSNIVFSKEISAKVVGVTDGDTITVLDKNKIQYKIRFYGIDTPEKKQAYGQKAKEVLSNKIFGKIVRLEMIKKDRYGRSIGKVYLGNIYINLKMVEDGWAWHYKHYSKDKDLSYAEKKARKAKLGLWKASNPTPPWKWRKGAGNHAIFSIKLKKLPIKSDFWVSYSSKTIHNSNCRFYKKSKGKFYKLSELTFGMKNCKICGGASVFTLKNNKQRCLGCESYD